MPYPYSLPLCYNRPAVKLAANREIVEALGKTAEASAAFESPVPAAQLSTVRNEGASRYCPVCSQRLESRRCKLICPVCGYYMSCSDYY
jgi:Zn finger protein HypA/HybF involved in hydrogenase expression